MTRPPRPPIVHRLEQRRADRSSDNVGAMFWAAVVVLIGLAGAVLVLGGR